MKSFARATAIFLLMLIHTSVARVLRVPQDYATPEAALLVNQPGDTIQLATQDYLLGANLQLDHGVTLRGAGPGRPRLIRTGNPVTMAASLQPACMENLELRSVVVSTDDVMCELRNCRLVAGHTRGNGIAVVDCIVDSSEVVHDFGAAIFVNTLFRDCQIMVQEQEPDLLFSQCVLLRCLALGVGGWIPYDDGQITLNSCTLIDCAGEPWYTFVGTSLNRLDLDRCLITGMVGPLIGSGSMIPDQLDITRTDIWSESGDSWTGALAPWLGQQGNIEADPLLCSPDDGDYRLQWDSPCLLDDDGEDVMGARPPGCVPAIHSLTASACHGTPPLNVDLACVVEPANCLVEWDLTGDGVIDGQGNAVSWTYRGHGDWPVRLRVLGSGGETVLDTLVIRVGGRIIHVPDSVATLDAALAQALPGDLVQLACGVYPAQGLVLPSGVWLQGTTGCTTLNAQGLGRALTVQTDVCDAELRDLVFVGGVADMGGALRIDHHNHGLSPTLRLAACRFQGNQATGVGGAIANTFPGPVIALDSCLFTGNGAMDGGAVHGGRLQARATRFAGNQAQTGGALGGLHDLTLTDCHFVGNVASERGGAVAMAEDADPLELIATAFSLNRAGVDGAAVWGAGGGMVVNCTFWGDSTAGSGAVLILQDAASGAAPSLSNCILANATGGRALGGSPALAVACTNLWANRHGNWLPPYEDALEQEGNLEDNPLFCDPAAEEFGLMVFSPCNDFNSPCGVMGASEEICPFTTLAGLHPRDMGLAPAHPNPFNPVTTLSFTLARPGAPTLRVVNLAGQEVAVLARGPRAAGPHQARFDASALASGLYLAVLDLDGDLTTQKLLLVR